MTSTAFFGALLVSGSLSTVHAQISTREQQAEQDALDARMPKLNSREEVLQLLARDGHKRDRSVGDRHSRSGCRPSRDSSSDETPFVQRG